MASEIEELPHQPDVVTDSGGGVSPPPAAVDDDAELRRSFSCPPRASLTPPRALDPPQAATSPPPHRLLRWYRGLRTSFRATFSGRRPILPLSSGQVSTGEKIERFLPVLAGIFAVGLGVASLIARHPVVYWSAIAWDTLMTIYTVNLMRKEDKDKFDMFVEIGFGVSNLAVPALSIVLKQHKSMLFRYSSIPGFCLDCSFMSLIYKFKRYLDEIA